MTDEIMRDKNSLDEVFAALQQKIEDLNEDR